MIGALAATVVAMGAVIAVLVASDDQEQSSVTQTVVTTTTSTDAQEPPPGEAECKAGEPQRASVDLLDSGLACEEAIGIYEGWQEQLAGGESIGSGGFASVGEWTCGAMPFGDRPLLFRCENESRMFVGVEPGERTPPVPSGEPAAMPTGKSRCGALPGPLSNKKFALG